MASIGSRWRALSPLARRATGFALLALPVATALLRVRGLAASRAFLARLPAGRLSMVPVSASLDEPGALHLGVEVASRMLFGAPRCLAKALVLERLANARGLSPQLRFAIDPDAATFDAHAWVDMDGRAFGALARYSANLDRKGSDSDPSMADPVLRVHDPRPR